MKKKTKSVDPWCAEKETEERSERGRARELVVRVERLKLGAESVVEVYRRTWDMFLKRTSVLLSQFLGN